MSSSTSLLRVKPGETSHFLQCCPSVNWYSYRHINSNTILRVSPLCLSLLVVSKPDLIYSWSPQCSMCCITCVRMYWHWHGLSLEFFKHHMSLSLSLSNVDLLLIFVLQECSIISQIYSMHTELHSCA